MNEFVPGRPSPSEHHEYFGNYIRLATETDIVDALTNQIAELQEVLNPVSELMSTQLHDPYTWNIKQVIGHCIDTERVFGYRIARFASADESPLVGFDQDQFVANTSYVDVTLSDLVKEFVLMRNSHLLMFRRFTPEVWSRGGTSDGFTLSVRAGAYILAGHLRHHLEIIKKRLAAPKLN